MATAMLGDRREAEDVAQEAFARALARPGVRPAVRDGQGPARGRPQAPWPAAWLPARGGARCGITSCEDDELRERFTEWAGPLRAAVPPPLAVIQRRRRRRTARLAAATGGAVAAVTAGAVLLAAGLAGARRPAPPPSPYLAAPLPAPDAWPGDRAVLHHAGRREPPAGHRQPGQRRDARPDPSPGPGPDPDLGDRRGRRPHVRVRRPGPGRADHVLGAAPVGRRAAGLALPGCRSRPWTAVRSPAWR